MMTFEATKRIDQPGGKFTAVALCQSLGLLWLGND